MLLSFEVAKQVIEGLGQRGMREGRVTEGGIWDLAHHGHLEEPHDLTTFDAQDRAA